MDIDAIIAAAAKEGGRKATSDGITPNQAKMLDNAGYYNWESIDPATHGDMPGDKVQDMFTKIREFQNKCKSRLGGMDNPVPSELCRRWTWHSCLMQVVCAIQLFTALP